MTSTVAISKKTVTVLIFGTMATVFIPDDDDGCDLQEYDDGIDLRDNDDGIIDLQDDR
jgi:hypothetical protein